MSQRIDEQMLKDVLIHLFNGKYSKPFVLEALAWGEQNTGIFWPLVKEFQPDYYNENLMRIFNNPIKVFTLMQDLKTKGVIQ